MQLQCDDSDVSWHRVHNAEPLPTANLLDWEGCDQAPNPQGSYNLHNHFSFQSQRQFAIEERIVQLLACEKTLLRPYAGCSRKRRWLGSIAADHSAS